MITGAQFIEHLYSQGYTIEEQREFGKTKSLKRGIKKPKKKISKHEKAIDKSFRRRDKLIKKIDERDSDSIFQNDTIDDKLKSKAREHRNFLVDSKSGKNYNINIEDPSIKKKNMRFRMKNLTNEEIVGLMNSDDLISYDKSKGGFSSLAHEMGHTFNRRTPGKLRDLEISGNRVAQKFNNIIDNHSTDSAIGGRKERKLESKAVIKSEKNATKTGIKLLKEVGASKEEIRASKKQLGRALKHYKEGGKIYKNTSRINKLRSLRGNKDILDITEY